MVRGGAEEGATNYNGQAHTTAPATNWAGQMAQLKLELAYCKAECDRTQWQFGQLLEKKQQADRKIASLERENRD
jgi:hypothetical protein